MLDSTMIVERFLDTKLQVHPDVVRYIREQKDERLIDTIISGVPDDCVVVSLRHIPGLLPSRDGVRFLCDPEVEIISGRMGTSKPVGRVEDYIIYFADRYARLSGMIRGRCNPVPIEALKRNSRYKQEEFAVCGMVMEVRSTGNGHRMAEIEDSTGSVMALFNKDRPDFSEAERIVPDEVIGVRGSLSSEGNLIFADQIFRPDIPFSYAPYTSDRKGAAVLISDVHVGSDTFLDDEWNRFADWLSDSEVSYLLVAGDLVDGIGIYPDQDKELVIPNIYEQYDVLGTMLSDLPSHLKIILAPGNHDVVRGAEPQPVIPEKFRKNYSSNCLFVENPALVNLQGVRVLMYHGRSFDDLIGLMPGASYEKAYDVIPEMLKRRHLAPCYGKRTPIAADTVDRLIIDPIPEVVHTGHVHIYGISRYRNVLGINSGTWQSQTAFQKQMNIQPTPAVAISLDLTTLQPRVHDFMNDSPEPLVL
ncbi:DNA-directed DNA polymerase II small subunit [Methanospirillum purgamenti]|uniref:DNA polymerase II small subunit n=1 Tax=Methanospirillum hungatei TaxID=2203 RepID=A0A8F5VJ59_METHU|nr:DNA-directed DNA polymerase II small subunit [Methanospirillum hungatei]QXO93784.1 DNA-directed DNA polymerase II small subunit [Methanospirillum hungatei]